MESYPTCHPFSCSSAQCGKLTNFSAGFGVYRAPHRFFLDSDTRSIQTAHVKSTVQTIEGNVDKDGEDYDFSISSHIKELEKQASFEEELGFVSSRNNPEKKEKKILKRKSSWNAFFHTRTKSLREGINWTKKTALPILTEALFLNSSENSSSASSRKRPTWNSPSYPELSGWDLVAADVATINTFMENIRLQFAIWRLPLEEQYDPEGIADYFNARPHIILFRAMQVSAAFSSLLLWFILERHVKSIISNEQTSEEYHRELSIRTAQSFKQTVLRLGPTFTKVAQSLSTRSDFVGPEAAKVLADLQDRLPPFSNEQAILTIKEEFGRPVNEVFTFFSDEPVAAASLGQVYRARTRDGVDVAVKIQRPNILHSIACDVYLLRLALGLVRKVAKINSDLSVFADEIGKGIYGELDYELEAANAMVFQGALSSKLSFVFVPKPLLHLTTKKVLTMEWVTGTRPVDLRQIANGQDESNFTFEQREEAKKRLLMMVNKGVLSSLTQLLDVGILHADPHPGNLLYTADNKIGYLDFGLICKMEKKHQYAMISATAHLVNGDWSYLVDDLAEMDILKPTIDRFRLTLALEDALSAMVCKEGLPDFRFSEMAGKLFQVALKFRFRLPPYYTLVLRSIASLEGMALAVDPDFKVFTRTYPYVLRRLLSDNSIAMRRTLRSLLLTRKKEFRWDRISSFIRIASMMDGTSSESTASDASSLKVVTTLWNLFLSVNSTAIRRVLLEADTRCLAVAFVSEDAAPVRRKMTAVISEALFCVGKELVLKQESSSPLRQPVSILKKKQLQVVVGIFLKRLKNMPLLMMRVGWTSFTMLTCALALSSHRLVVAAVTETSPSPSPSSPSSLSVAAT